MNKRKVIEVCGDKTRLKHHKIENISGLTIYEGERIAIVGANGSGKSTLSGILTGVYPLVGDGVKYDFGGANNRMVYENIKFIAFRDSYGADDSDYYYQQRWNSNDIIGRKRVMDELPEIDNSPLKERLFELFGINDILDKQLLLLSSGEMRKFQLTKTLLSNPQIIIIDNPFIGLDETTRNQLQLLLSQLYELSKIQVIIILSQDSEIPQFITHVISLEKQHCCGKLPLSEYIAQRGEVDMSAQIKKSIKLIKGIKPKPLNSSYTTAVELRDVTIKYGDRTILSQINWRIKRGEKWALSGNNGSGKSTLLSLLCADNPQSYACDITLFGRKRGSGESIWDIKRHIGYSSPELHRSYLKSIPSINIVASGLFDTLGIYQHLDEQEVETCTLWMQIFGIEDLAQRNFMQLSSGEQRMILLARAFVKDPELLILDEPLHGLDSSNRKLVLEVINTFMNRGDKTGIFVTHYINELPSTITNHIKLRPPERECDGV
ncbi:MAG: ATP-binding cassette domain-containing protein [Rikenellaceae bacterium]